MTGTHLTGARSLAVDTAALNLLAERIRRAAAEARAVRNDPGLLYATIDSLGMPVLVQAARAFMHDWSRALTDLVDDAHRLADAIDLVSRGYQDAESVADQAVHR